MKIVVINGHWKNRGDEAAIVAMVDAFKKKYNDCSIYFHSGSDLLQFPHIEQFELSVIPYGGKHNLVDLLLIWITRGKFAVSKGAKKFCKLLSDADVVIHAPGGPSIGDIYPKSELGYWIKLLTAYALKKPYYFYAPSMGPFKNKTRNIIRRFIYNHAELVVTREGISGEYFRNLRTKKKINVTMDSAFQNEINTALNEEKLAQYEELKTFLNSYKKVVGITITDLAWHPVFKNDEIIKKNIDTSFNELIKYLNSKNIGVLFVPQLFGGNNDKKLMEQFKMQNCFVMSDSYDCLFQQYIIGKLWAVVGMRYHSNIFSAKMQIPFISISYEQKMRGFMELNNLSKYYIDITQLTSNLLIEKFKLIEADYDEYKKQVEEVSIAAKAKARLTTTMICESINDVVNRKK